MKRKIPILKALTILAALSASSVGAFTLGVPEAPVICNTADLSKNNWLSQNDCYAVSALVAPVIGTNAISVALETVPGAKKVSLNACEAGFVVERVKPEYYLADCLEPPANVDWTATYDQFLASGAKESFLFDNNASRVYVTAGGSVTFDWVLNGGTVQTMTYTVAQTCQGRPRRIFWTDYPYNSPGVNLSGKFVKFYGNPEILSLKYGVSTNFSAGVTQVMTNRVTSGLYVDPASMVLYAAGELSGQVIMAYYDSGNYDVLTAVQVVEVSKPGIIPCKGVIGEALQPNGVGYDTTDLIAQMTVAEAEDERGPYLYQHQGSYSYSPKHGQVFPIRPTVGERWKAEIYWMETDAMGVRWPFVVCQYECDWPENAKIFVRGDIGGDTGRKIFFPSQYTPELMKFQEPEGHAVNISTDGVFDTKGEGYSLVKITGDDNVWFLPVHSVFRGNADYFSISEADLAVGSEARPRLGVDSGATARFNDTVDSDISGYIYQAASGTHWNHNIYYEPTSDTTGTGNIDVPEVSTDGTVTTVKLPSVIYPVNVPQGDSGIEVWWCTSFQKDDMPVPVEIPCLPQRYNIVWPDQTKTPQIVIASQSGSASESLLTLGTALQFTSTRANLPLPSRASFGENGGTVMFWTRAQSFGRGAIVTFGDDGIDTVLSVEARQQMLQVNFGGAVIQGRFPSDSAGEWTHIAVCWDTENAVFYVNGERQGSAPVSPEQIAELSDVLAGNSLGANTLARAQGGREVAELSTWRRPFTETELSLEKYRRWNGDEIGLTTYFSFRSEKDFVTANNGLLVTDRVLGTDQLAQDMAVGGEGPLGLGTGVFQSDTTPVVYAQNDPLQPGYNPNEEHAFVRTGNGGYVAWALRCDLNREDTSEPGVLVQYELDGRPKMQFFGVALTNNVYPELAAPCTAGRQLPGPHPLDLFDNPWLKDTYWDRDTNDVCAVGFRDRKGQLWARCAGTLPIHMYYAMQEGFDFPSLETQPAVGTPIPWLACLADPKADPLEAKPAVWTWNVSWPVNVPEMCIGQTLTTAADGLPEVWNAKSMAVLYPDTTKDKTVVVLTDPTVARKIDFPYSNLALLGMKTGGNEKLTLMKGKYYFNGLPPSLSERVYLNPNGGPKGQLTLIGQKESNPGGVELLHFNLLNEAERKALANLAVSGSSSESQAAKASWDNAVGSLKNLGVVEPSTLFYDNNEDVKVKYEPVDHYALTAVGGTNYVTVIENDSSVEAMGVSAGDPISMHVFKVVDKYYTGRIVTREDPVNLLSQQLDVLYSEGFAGKAEDYIFEWRRATPRPNGTMPDDYENEYTQKFDIGDSQGLTRFTIGAQGDTLANMVNTYYVMRYRAVDTNSTAYAVMEDRWSEWCAPPALAEGWVQRVLNNVTPFTQRMQDLYANAAETAVSMIQQAGPPYTGDVALNQDNLTSVGLIQLYETILNKAESMSLLLGVNDGDANKQLLLAAERLADLYTVLGDEAYSDAMNPTIGFGSNFGEVEGGLGIDYGAASSSLFCFDNQVPSLLEEELALLRGRSCANAPDNTIGPCYNRLMWNFTRGITAGEVAYAVNYNISGTKSSTIDYQQAATMYPQGHGDAYGHYLSALMGWYRLLRNPYFSWGTPGMGEMVVADNVVNVDYYDESKFASAAANVAKTAADIVERTARKAWKDGDAAKSGGGYLDADANRAFGYGEWASRGGYGALCNWVVANSLVPARNLPEDASALADEGLVRIDRTTVGEIADIASQVKAIQKTVDTADRGCNPLGFADGTIPFDITPIGASDGSNTHYEQIRARAQKALANASRVLDHAQTYANRLRMIEEVQSGYEDNLDTMEQDYNSQLISIFGYPYEDDIGPSGTYPQGYDGPDIYHYMWMDYRQYGITDMNSLDVVKIVLVNEDHEYSRNGTVSFALSANGLIQKPSNISGTRRAQGEIQQAYADFIQAYVACQFAVDDYSSALDDIEDAFDDCKTAQARAAAKLALSEVVSAGKETCMITASALEVASSILDFSIETAGDAADMVLDSVPSISGAGLTVNFDPRALAAAPVNGVRNVATSTMKSAKLANERAGKIIESVSESLDILKDSTEAALDYVSEVEDAQDALGETISELEGNYRAMRTAWAQMISAQEVYNTVIAKGARILEARELSRQQAVNNITKLKYNDMFFRKQRNEALTRYNTSFDIAQRYVFLAAKAYDYETGLLSADQASGDAFIAEIIGARTLGNLAPDGTPLPGGAGDPGLADILYRMDANWDVLKPRLGVNNPQQYATWFSLRRELFRILPGASGDLAWRNELAKYRVDNILALPEYRRFCQPLQCVDGLHTEEPGFVIPFSTTIDFAQNFFGKELAGGDAAFDSTYFSTKIAAAGVWFTGYNGRLNDNGNVDAMSRTPNVYLIPVGLDCMRAPGQDENSYLSYNVVDQTIPVPFDIGATQLDSTDWTPLYEGFTDGADLGTRIRRHPSFRAYFGTEPNDSGLDCTRLVGRSVWNTKWLLIIPAGSLSADREGALAAFLRGQDIDRDGTADISGVSDICIGFKTYANSGN